MDKGQPGGRREDGGVARGPGGPQPAFASCFPPDSTGVTGSRENPGKSRKILRTSRTGTFGISATFLRIGNCSRVRSVFSNLPPPRRPNAASARSLGMAEVLPPAQACKSLSTYCVQGEKQRQRPSRLRGRDRKDPDGPGLGGHAAGERGRRTAGRRGPPLPPTACPLLGDPAGPRASPALHPRLLEKGGPQRWWVGTE